MKISTLLLVICVLFASHTVHSQLWKKYPSTRSGSLISFPADEGSHSNEPIEWWYTVGHLVGESTGTHYSFMLTYFHYPQLGFDGFRILNLSNDNTGKFYGETLPVHYPVLSEDSLNIKASVYTRGTETWLNKLDQNGQAIPFEYTIVASSASGSLKIDYVAVKPPLILADSGFFYQGASSYTYYYSQTENRVSGTITLGGVTEKVTGTSWIDRQYGSFNPVSGEKYEWFNLQLSNGMDINLFNIFTNDNRTPSSINYKTMAAYVDTASQYTTADFHLERLAFQYTADSARCYSQKWRLTSAINKIDVTIEAPYKDYEVKLPFRFYEGPTTISGTVNGKSVTGKGFAELLHSYEKPNVAFAKHPTDTFSPIVWKLSNPDEARPIKYDLAYSLDNKNYVSIANALTDTSYSWPNQPKSNYWLKLTAYSNDTTLVNYAYSFVEPLITSVEEGTMDRYLEVFPNPVQDILYIHTRRPFAKLDIQISNMQGDIVTEKLIMKEDQMLLDVSNLNAGIYFLQVHMDDQIKAFKIVVQ